MKITMLGKSGSGKTSFMSGIHELFINNRVLDFALSPQSKNIKDGISKIGQIDAISFHNLKKEHYHASKKVVEWSFPDGTQKTTRWIFDLNHGRHFITNIEWIDYRGGVIDDMFMNSSMIDSTKKSDINTIIKQIKGSHAIMLFADSTELILNHDESDRFYASGARALSQIMRTYSRESHLTKNIVILIVLTKADSDLIPENMKNNNYSGLVRRGKEVFKEVISLCRYEKNWIGGMIATGAIGEGRSETAIQNFNQSLKKKKKRALYVNSKPILRVNIKEVPRPFHIDDAVMFTIQKVCEFMAKAANEEILRCKSEIRKATSGLNGLSFIFSGRQQSIVDELQRIINMQQKNLALLDPVINSKNNLYKNIIIL